MSISWVRVGVACAVVLWTAIAWGVAYLLGVGLDAGGDALVAVGEQLSFHPTALHWLEAFLGVLAGLGKGLVFLVWLVITLVILVFGGVAQGFAPLLRTAWATRKRVAPAAMPEVSPPRGGETYDVAPDHVRHD